MKYLELTFDIAPYSSEVAEVLMVLVAEAGLESFLEIETGFKGYAQTAQFEPEVLDETIASFLIPDIKIGYTITEAEDKNWNEEWEKNGFSPIEIAGKVIIHSSEHTNFSPVEYDMLINPCQAFGTGSHQTTYMIVERLLGMELKDKSVLDAGCGTGVLGIFCGMKGAGRIFAYDIDNWSVRNAMENMKLNHIENMEVVEGDASVLLGQETFDLILANINRNILLNDMPSFFSVMHQGSRLILSGFYTEDMELIVRKARELGLSYLNHTEKDNWVSLLFER